MGLSCKRLRRGAGAAGRRLAGAASLSRPDVALSFASCGLRGLALARRRELHTRTPGFRQPNRDRLLRRSRAMLPFPDVLDLFVDELAGLRGWGFAFLLVLPGAFQRGLRRHISPRSESDSILLRRLKATTVPRWSAAPGDSAQKLGCSVDQLNFAVSDTPGPSPGLPVHRTCGPLVLRAFRPARAAFEAAVAARPLEHPVFCMVVFGHNRRRRCTVAAGESGIVCDRFEGSGQAPDRSRLLCQGGIR
jgi:hypothetical protein